MFVYMYLSHTMHCRFNNSTPNKNTEASLASLVSFMGWSSLSRVATGTTRGPSTGSCCSGLTSVPSSPRWPPTDYCSSHIVEQWHLRYTRTAQTSKPQTSNLKTSNLKTPSSNSQPSMLTNQVKNTTNSQQSLLTEKMTSITPNPNIGLPNLLTNHVQ